MITPAILASLSLSLVLSTPSLQQSAFQSPHTEEPDDYPFAVVNASTLLTVNGDWRESSALRRYANVHSGTYIVFARQADYFLLSDSAKITEVLRSYQEVARLGRQQEGLEAKQAALAKRQEQLASEMKKQNSPEQMRRIAAEQGNVGIDQALIGREQASVGQEQGTVGRKFYSLVQGFFEACLRDRSCRKV